MSNTEFQSCRKFVRNNLAEKKIKIEQHQNNSENSNED